MEIDTQRLADVLALLWPSHATPTLLDGWCPALSTCEMMLDSREAGPGVVFVAVPGVDADGRAFIEQALASGADAVLYDTDAMPEGIPVQDARVLGVPELRGHLGELGRHLFGVSETLELIGVTGTNGKSSVTHYMAALSESLGTETAVIGTLGVGRPGQLESAALTTPGPLALQAALGELGAQGVERVAMEVSSHALAQGRVAGCRFQAAVFTNISRDHLDYHGSMAAYAAAKARLFKHRELSLAVVNGDDLLAPLMLAGLPKGVRVLATGCDEATTLRVIDWFPHALGQRALIATPEGERELELSLLGRFNLDNVLLAMATLYGLGSDLTALFDAASKLAPVPGRMQRLVADGAPTVVVDYAHTPEALRNALDALRAHVPAREGAKLWCVFGCGGDRDRGKRPLMAQAAEALADRLVVTDDNPRGESAAAIRDAVVAGLSAAGKARMQCVAGRGEAIEHTLQEAGADDIVLIAGKGHETYQDIDGRRYPFSDVEVVEAAFERRREHGA
ncbi:UDP-N-acetylmuramoyl-L-alanyl-D-glutamate--2,6-diaminopimelate ligase [Chromohalobacter nigrandesensis]|uniref:UDP-N-acetylmuramoyl-L-alanyl-D-glutamate--2, 6-diaminopimelate ligase n=1 Tax=Chromohalobacter nigrandesensis TaxID=119863 RepID=UPI001FF352F5|nr:UDP-N-acetylmuramoyl-L-alanyl-D-glutamate--2,6-diaminopimelate ligase [Chromohalobacter nigrandesensis]MCK0745649.1 UDP-N-acetylmuramoyl-L-alanyl-D-glutamate--2,6-diaminopimelate ligase [Chromohalobacter nigrandesensis]